MAIEIKYNGVNPFGTRTPFVSREFNRQEVNGYISGVTRLTLSGSRPRPNASFFPIIDSDGSLIADSDGDSFFGTEPATEAGSIYIRSDGTSSIFRPDGSSSYSPFAVVGSACNASFLDYKNDFDLLKYYFSQQFKSFEILENSNQIFYHPAAKIISITFPESNFSGFYRYEIIIDCIASYSNSNILEPVDQWTTDEAADSTVTITHTVSARGVGDRAFEKARDFVFSQSDGADDVFLFMDGGIETFLLLDNDTTPLLVDSKNRKYPLISRKSFCNRLTGEFRMVETWLYNPEYTGAGYGVITYTTSVSESEGTTTLNISGEIQVARVEAAENEIVNAKTTFDSIDFQAIAQSEYEENGGTLTLASIVNLSVTENPDLGTVSFDMGWNSQAESSPYIIDTSTVSVNKSGGVNCFQYTGRVKSDSGCPGTRYDLVKTFFENINWDARVLQKWSVYGTGETLTANAKSKSVSYNPFSGEITFSIEYCAEVEVECSAIEAFKYTMEFTPSIQKYAPEPILNGLGYYSVQNLGFKNRKQFAISGSAKRVKCYSKESAIGEIKSRVNLLMLKYFPGANKVLINSQIEEDKNGDFFSFNFTWSADARYIASEFMNFSGLLYNGSAIVYNSIVIQYN